LRRFLDALDGNTNMRLVLISTTGVYGDCAGRWIDESEPPRPATDRTRRRLDAECSAQCWGCRTGVPVIVLRVPGIYGPGRLPIERLRRGMLVPAAARSPFTNRIHVDDLVSVCVAAAEKGTPGSVFNVTDGSPERMTDYFMKVAAITGVAPPQVTSLTEAQRVASPALSAYFAESRRIRNAKLRTELGIELRYPNLDAGLAASIDLEHNVRELDGCE
jgi:nucleoside-diphosphate-sugar epimerase